MEQLDADATENTKSTLLLFAYLFGLLRIRIQGPPTKSWRTEWRVARVRAKHLSRWLHNLEDELSRHEELVMASSC